MDTHGVCYAEALDRLGNDALALAQAKGLEGFVLQAAYPLPVVAVAHPPFERGVPAASRVGERATQLLGSDRRSAELEGGHGPAARPQPPATGGMNTTASPSASGAVHSRNSALMATRSTSGVSEKG